MGYYISLDIGGSHITSGLVTIFDDKKSVDNIFHQSIDNSITADQLLANISDCIAGVIDKSYKSPNINGITIAMPGPFDYKMGVSRIKGVNKFDTLFALDLKVSLLNRLVNRNIQINQLTFLNDAKAFLLGSLHQNNNHSNKVLAITIGTGIGSASYSDGVLFSGLMDDDYLYKSSFKNGIAEDYFSTKWFLNQAAEKKIDFNTGIIGVKELANRARGNPQVQDIFNDFGKNLAEYLNGLVSREKVDRIIFGGKVFRSFQLFRDSFQRHFTKKVEVHIVDETSEHSLLGAAIHHQNRTGDKQTGTRNSISPVLPVKKPEVNLEVYDIYPAHSIGKKKIDTGYRSLVEFLLTQDSGTITIDGNVGTIWDNVISQINLEFSKAGKNVNWYCIDAATKSEQEITSMLEDYLGGDDPLFGFKFNGSLKEFFDDETLKRIPANPEKFSIIYGTGASLAGWIGPVIYIDQPKNEIKYRSRAGSITNLGSCEPEDPKKMYKRFYFVDWPVCNKHKQQLSPNITAVVDGQRPETITWMKGDEFRSSLENMAKSPFRVRPWFEPGVWGGQWMKEKFNGLNREAENYAWSFEIIAPENGIIFESDGAMLEVGFEFLLYHNNKAVLGLHAEEYGYYFPLRFDYLDTMDGKNLSLQCHPKQNYMKKKFGEQITQDETYYIVDAEPDAEVYLGFQENISPDQFQVEFRECERSGKLADVNKFVQTFPSNKHDLFLIPTGTIHCSGANNLVLEISNTPYIFTFKIYDWQRLDLDGKPRPLNISRAMENLDFDRKGSLIREKFISKPEIQKEGEGWKIVNLPTHKEHLYSIHRLEFKKSIKISTESRFHVLNLVEGESVNIISKNQTTKLCYAETVVIPAATGEYVIENNTDNTAKVVKAFMK